MFTVELVDRVCRKLKRGRSAGSGEIRAEHLLYSHPLLILQLSLLFRIIILYSHVPDAFGPGMIIPVPKGDDCDLSSTDKYRAITISPCISKLFELCLSSVSHPWLQSDELQSAFKKAEDVAMQFLPCVELYGNVRGALGVGGRRIIDSRDRQRW